MLKPMIMALAVVAGPIWAEDWHALTGAEITTALSSRVLAYQDGTTQNFFGDGRTLFETASGEGQSWGRWRVDGDLYCSTWPPSESWACYGLEAEADGLDLRFVAADGRLSIGRYQDLQ